MTHNLTLFLLKTIQAKNYMNEAEYESVCYSLEILFINIFKSIQVYTAAFIFGVLVETFIMNLAYALLRWSAGGWHAKSSLNCSIFGIITFVGIPFALQKTEFLLTFHWSLFLSLLILFCVFLYAPADTEKNPLVSVIERKRKRRLALLCTTFILCIGLVLVKSEVRTLIIIGLLVETIMIHPLLYKLTKRSYKNYENYQVQP